MLSAEVYEAIGRLTVAFNDVDYMMTACLTEYAEEGEVSEITEENDPGFERKRDALKKRLKAIETEFPNINRDLGPRHGEKRHGRLDRGLAFSAPVPSRSAR
jgi:hypothetical protein